MTPWNWRSLIWQADTGLVARVRSVVANARVRAPRLALMAELLEPLPAWLKVTLGVISTAGPLFTLLAALIAGGIAIMAYKQRKRADNQAEWWRRAQWALDHAADEDVEKGRIGLRALEYLLKSSLTTQEDRLFTGAVLTEIISVTVRRAEQSPEPMDKGRWWHKTRWWRRGEADAQTEAQGD